MTELEKTGLDKNETERDAVRQEQNEILPDAMGERIETKLNEIRDEIGSRINPVFVAANKFSSNVRQALDLETDPGLLEEPEYGDVICVHRIGYEHYGIYAGANKVIHYDIDPSDHYKICIHQADMEEFLNGALFTASVNSRKCTGVLRRKYPLRNSGKSCPSGKGADPVGCAENQQLSPVHAGGNGDPRPGTHR